MALLQSAIAIRERLARENPSITHFREDLAKSHMLKSILENQMGRPIEAMASLERNREICERLAVENPTIIEFQRGLANSHNFGGILHENTGRIAEALLAYGRAREIFERLAREYPSVIEFQDGLANSYHNIGHLQQAARRTAEALAAHEQAHVIRERLAREHPQSPDLASALGSNLNSLAAIDLERLQFEAALIKLRQAIVWQRKALSANSQNPKYQKDLTDHLTYLIRAAQGLGRADEAEKARRELAELAAGHPAMTALDARLAAVLKGDQLPKDNAERLELAQRGYDKALHATAARLFAEAFAADPALGDDRLAQYRFNAACAAALAAAGRGKDDPPLDAPAKAKLRHQALEWLKAELTAWKRIAMSAEPGNKETVARTLTRWKTDTDLASIRDIRELAKLPEDERKSWQDLWKDVDLLLRRAERK